MNYEIPNFKTPQLLILFSLVSIFAPIILSLHSSFSVHDGLSNLSLSGLLLGFSSCITAFILGALRIDKLSDAARELEQLLMQQKGHPSTVTIQRVESIVGLQRVWLKRAFRSITLLPFVLVFCIILFFSTLPKSFYGYILVGVLIVTDIFLLILIETLSTINATEYRSLPHSTSADGHHRCIYCGGRGIYKHGQYKSNTVWHDCSKCGVTLFTS